MRMIWRTLSNLFFITILLTLPAVGMAADFELYWDPNCNADPDLEGYFIYYKHDASVIADPSGAIDIYVDLTDAEFDPDNPSILIPDLLDDEPYCFAITAWYGSEESDLSNEVCGINGTYASDSDPDPDPNPGLNPNPGSDPAPNPSPGDDPGNVSSSGGSNSSGGCFIGSLK